MQPLCSSSAIPCTDGEMRPGKTQDMPGSQGWKEGGQEVLVHFILFLCPSWDRAGVWGWRLHQWSSGPLVGCGVSWPAQAPRGDSHRGCWGPLAFEFILSPDISSDPGALAHLPPPSALQPLPFPPKPGLTGTPHSFSGCRKRGTRSGHRWLY